GGVGNAVLLLEHAAHEDVAGWLEIGAADPLADQILWLSDTTLGVDENEAMPKAAMSEHGDGSPGPAAVACHHVCRRIELADVVRIVLGHRPVPFLGAIPGVGDKLNAFRLGSSVRKRTGDFIIAAG